MAGVGFMDRQLPDFIKRVQGVQERAAAFDAHGHDRDVLLPEGIGGKEDLVRLVVKHNAVGGVPRSVDDPELIGTHGDCVVVFQTAGARKKSAACP